MSNENVIFNYGEKISADYAGFADENCREIQKP